MVQEWSLSEERFHQHDFPHMEFSSMSIRRENQGRFYENPKSMKYDRKGKTGHEEHDIANGPDATYDWSQVRGPGMLQGCSLARVVRFDYNSLVLEAHPNLHERRELLEEKAGTQSQDSGLSLSREAHSHRELMRAPCVVTLVASIQGKSQFSGNDSVGNLVRGTPRTRNHAFPRVQILL